MGFAKDEPGAGAPFRTNSSSRTIVPPEHIREKVTFCNPLNIDYHFRVKMPSAREAADPVIIRYKGDYYLFASKSGGFWWSADLLNWNLVETKSIPFEAWNPALAVIGDELYYKQQLDAFYKSSNPKAGEWARVRDKIMPSNDDWLFADDNGRVYLYAVNPTPRSHAVRELDPANNLAAIGPLLPIVDVGIFESRESLPDNEPFPENAMRPGCEGSQMTKHKGLYYFQLSWNPSFCFADYAGEAYVSKSPVGPFRKLPNNPVSFRPYGFNSGAANCAWFEDHKDEWWNVVTVNVSSLDAFERRVGLYPSYFDEDDLMYSDSYLADLPQYLPGFRKPGPGGNLVGWMLVSYGKPVTVSSSLETGNGVLLKHLDSAGKVASSSLESGIGVLPKREGRIYECKRTGGPELTVDEDMQSWWSAKTGDKGEWLAVDLEKVCRINAIQVNFAEQDTTALGRRAQDKLYHQYTLEVSDDGKKWTMLVDKSRNDKDVPHDYIQLENPVHARHVRLTNIHMPGNGKFAVRALRVFGSGLGELPAPVESFTVKREPGATTARLEWEPAEGAEAYVIRYGIAPDKLYSSQDVRCDQSRTLTRLMPEMTYYFSVDSFNDSGVCFGTVVLKEGEE